jgi:6-phosphofructokinase 2
MLFHFRGEVSSMPVTQHPAALPIAVLCLNPAVDVTYEVPHLIANQKTYASSTRYDPGGNGINVGRALRRLRIAAKTFCVTGGEMGDFLKRMLAKQLEDVFYEEVEGETRVNGTILERETDSQFEVSGIGPELSPEHLEHLIEHFLAAAHSYAVITGSIQPNLSAELYADLTRRVREQGGRPIVDAPVKLLKPALEGKPFLIKPNLFELESLLNKPLTGIDAVAEEARRLQRKGIDYVCVSLGPDGALLAGPDNIYHAKAPAVEVCSTVGAGDAMVAGLTTALAHGEAPFEALRHGIACGSGTVCHAGTELFSLDDISALTPGIEVHTLDR